MSPENSATSKQVAWLNRQHIDTDGLTKGEAYQKMESRLKQFRLRKKLARRAKKAAAKAARKKHAESLHIGIMNLIETSSWEVGQIEAGIIRNVKVLGATSRNHRQYPTEVRQSAIKLLEGSKVNLDHVQKGKEQTIHNRFGKLVNVHDDGSAVFADLHYLQSHPMAATIQEAAEKMPEILGLSIRGEGKTRTEKDTEIVESIDRIHSVDLVCDPATNSSLFEAAEDDAEEEEAMSAEDAHMEGVKDAILALIDEQGDLDDTLKKIKELLKSHAKIYAKEEGDEEGESEEGPEDEKPDEQEESYKQRLATLEEEVKQLKKKSLIKKPVALMPVQEQTATDWNALIRGRI